LALRYCVRIMFAHRVDIQIVPNKQFGKGGNNPPQTFCTALMKEEASP